jgi:hypothetical protein
MARHRTNDAAADTGASEQPETSRTETPPAQSAETGETEQGTKTAWAKRFGSWTDNLAGVHLTEDRQNRRMLIQFDEKPSAEVRALLKGEPYGYRFDAEDKAWYKPINPAKPRQVREDADNLFLEVANLIRKEKGLEPHKALSVG